MKFQSIKTSKLSKNYIYQILKLKNTNWKFSYNSQVKWFKENVLLRDYHNVMLNNNKIVGYTFLGNRCMKVIYNNKILKKTNYILFSTLILNKKFRNYYYASKFMKFNHNFISKKKKPSFLLCKNNKMKFYKFFNWSKIRKKQFKVADHKHNLIGMSYNLLIKGKERYIFYYNR